MSELNIGTSIQLSNGVTARVKQVIGKGGQGTVYLVEASGKKMALKWYHKYPGDIFYRNILNNIKDGAPAPNFIWPLAITTKLNGSFGYVMELRPMGYKDMSQFLLVKAKFSNIYAELNACLQICTAFQKLHIRGLSYQDMNDGNFFINPKTGDVLICDNDNVAPDRTNMGILGKAGYMAPEVVEGVTMPNRYTDYYSLAVCLFILIYMNKPFEGNWHLDCPCDNNPEMAKKLFGFESVFIMDKTNSKNRPVPGIHNNIIRRWNIFPSFLGEAFCKTFSTEAIKEPGKRLMDKQWHNILLQVRSMFAKCPNCGKDTFIDILKKDSRCIHCNETINIQVLKIGRFSIPLVDKQKIYSCMVSSEQDKNLITAEVIKKGGTIGLRNLSNTIWTVILPDGSTRIINNGDDMPAKAGFKIRFGQEETGEII
ncbi:MAG: serine/threonine protein kinase [Bacteroidales bacterium]|nr:serine/threonine protein kinase [Bacteroidales bacterium]